MNLPKSVYDKQVPLTQFFPSPSSKYASVSTLIIVQQCTQPSVLLSINKKHYLCSKPRTDLIRPGHSSGGGVAYFAPQTFNNLTIKLIVVGNYQGQNLTQIHTHDLFTFTMFQECRGLKMSPYFYQDLNKVFYDMFEYASRQLYQPSCGLVRLNQKNETKQ